MAFWKKNGMQLLTLVLCAVLLVLNLFQRAELAELKGQLNAFSYRLDRLDGAVNDTSGMVARELEEVARVAADYDLHVTGMDQNSRRLLAQVSVTLRQWREDTAVTLLVDQTGETEEFPMAGQGGGTFYADVSIPAEGERELSLSVLVDTAGTVTREELGGWGDVSMLLPLQLSSWGGSTPRYQNGAVQIDSYSVDLETTDGQAASEKNASYRLYVNDKLVKEAAACQGWEQSCQAGDIVMLTFACEDEFGLGYEFCLYQAMITERGGMDELPVEEPKLTWD